MAVHCGCGVVKGSLRPVGSRDCKFHSGEGWSLGRGQVGGARQRRCITVRGLWHLFVMVMVLVVVDFAGKLRMMMMMMTTMVVVVFGLQFDRGRVFFLRGEG